MSSKVISAIFSSSEGSLISVGAIVLSLDSKSGRVIFKFLTKSLQEKIILILLSKQKLKALNKKTSVLALRFSFVILSIKIKEELNSILKFLKSFK